MRTISVIYFTGNCSAVFDGQNGLTALHLAAKEGRVSTVHILLSRGADILAATKVCSCDMLSYFYKPSSCLRGFGSCLVDFM